MPEGDRTRMGGTMRLGSRVTVLRPGSRAFELYGGIGSEELEVRYQGAVYLGSRGKTTSVTCLRCSS